MTPEQLLLANLVMTQLIKLGGMLARIGQMTPEEVTAEIEIQEKRKDELLSKLGIE